MSRLFLPTLSIALLLFTATVSTAQEDEARRQEEQPRAEREQPKEREQAVDRERNDENRRRIMDRQREVPERFAQPEIRERAMAGLEKQIEEMRRVGGNETRIAQAERMLESLRGASAESPQPPRPETPHGQPEAARRLEHMRAAVEHLRQAGLVDQANQVTEMAARLQQEMRREGREREGDPIREIMNQLGEMRREIGELRERLDRRER